MKPAPFLYVRPHTVDEALAELARPDGDAKILAGGRNRMSRSRTTTARSTNGC
jgi:CO/xanthine dehydrogenase FAD-binding subunit